MMHARVWRILIGASLFLPVESIGAQSPAIRVVLLGTGRPDPAIDRFGPATLVEAGGQKLLFDAGRPLYRNDCVGRADDREPRRTLARR